MKSKVLIFIILAALVFGMLAGCGKKDAFLTAEDAQKAAMEAVGVTAKDVADAHPHTGMIDEIPHYNIHLTLKNGTEYNIIINALTGEVVDGI